MPAESQMSLVHETPLLQQQTRVYVNEQKKSDYFNRIADYMFWGATSILAGLAVGLLGVATVAPTLMAIGGVASAAALVGSLYFSNKATEISEKSNVLYSDIDSQHQAHRMVQAFAKAQSQEAEPSIPMLEASSPSSTQWQDRVGGVRQAQGKSGWAATIAAQAEREDAAMLNVTRGL